jgi:hypothetical protein
METTFTIISENDNHLDWPEGQKVTVSLVEGDLATRIRRAAVQHERAPVVITEYRKDSGYSESTRDYDFKFTLRVGNEEISLPHAYNSVAALTTWLDAHDEEHIQCEYDSYCLSSATYRVMSRREGKVLNACENHKDTILNEGSPEYDECCPDCGCWFGVN